MKTGKYFLSFLFIFILGANLLCAQQAPKINPSEVAENQINSLSKDIPDLDDFQKLELRDFIIENTNKVKGAMESNVDSDNLQLIILNTSRDFDNKLKEVLLPEQFEKYMELRRKQAAEGENKKKKNKRNKDKKRLGTE
ncbi:hypothetical protein [Apibacter sp. HY039]|uniref:hypothetical protein n=1 Tax=Apibacter sp. HY039 TaxID=2501476 RepID=UPI000FEB758A|nr:hypothetical protein [Apibacter sp. HY039]